MSTPPRTREVHSPASSTGQPGRQTNNDALAANLATSLPKCIPSRACANSAKKRRHAPNLSRVHPSPSREERVSTLFQNTAPNLTLSNTCRLRRPLAEARHTSFGEYDADHVRKPYSYRSPPNATKSRETPGTEASGEPSGKEDESKAKPRPLRRIFSPSAWHTADSNNYVDASLEPALRRLSSAADRDDPQELDESYKENVEAWLHGTQHLPSDKELASTGSWSTLSSSSSATKTSTASPMSYPKLPTTQAQPDPPPKDRSSSSDKENISPTPGATPPSPSPSRPQVTRLPTSTTPSRFRNPSSSAKPILHLAPPKRTGVTLLPSPTASSSPPKGYFATPPRRGKGANAVIRRGGTTPSTPSSRLSFCIFEDATGEAGGVAAAATPPLPATFTAPDDWKPVVTTAGASNHGQPTAGPGDFTVTREGPGMMEALARLSPSVEVRRRGRKREGDGRGMGRGRCASYWDEDVMDGLVRGEGGRRGSGVGMG